MSPQLYTGVAHALCQNFCGTKALLQHRHTPIEVVWLYSCDKPNFLSLIGLPKSIIVLEEGRDIFLANQEFTSSLKFATVSLSITGFNMCQKYMYFQTTCAYQKPQGI